MNHTQKGEAPARDSAQMVRLCSRYGVNTFRGETVPLAGGLWHVRRMREENERAKSGLWQDREWWLEDSTGNRVEEAPAIDK